MNPDHAPACVPGAGGPPRRRSAMLEEARSAPEVVQSLLEVDHEPYAVLADRLRRRPGEAMVTLARGSSDHAAQHLAYLAMARLGRLVTSLPPSLLTLWGGRAALAAPLALAFSQSGRSPDLVEPLKRLREAGSCTVAVVNDAASPLAAAAEHVLPLHAGVESSVAATKSFIAQLAAGLRLLAAWDDDAALRRSLPTLPELLGRAAVLDWTPAVDALAGATQAYVVGRGPGLAIAQEAALKFKETCGLQAEAYSGAELQHGPIALAAEGFPVLVLAIRGPAQPGLLALAGQLHQRGARVLLAAPPGADGPAGALRLPLVTAAHEDLDATAVIQTFYPMVEALARERGRDPDRPPFLSKVTLTQ